MSADRHEKWVRVEPGTVIPAGQPYRVEREYLASVDVQTDDDCWFVDSSWRPPLNLPTEPTWGIVITEGPTFGHWVHIEGGMHRADSDHPMWHLPDEDVTDFIPLTDEQVRRVESAS